MRLGARSSWATASGIAIVLAVVVQIVFLHNSWFYLDDVRDISTARDGLSWDMLTTPIAEHLTIGHRLMDWIVAVPLGRQWGWAVALVIAWAGVGLAYLALTLRQLFGEHARLAIPVFLAGTAWPLLGTGRWFSGAALVVPVFAAMAAAIFHHLRWRESGSRGHWAGSIAWTVVGLLFSVQGVFFAPLLLVAALVQRPAALRSATTALRELLAVVPVGLLGVALALYERGQPWAPETTVPSVGDSIDLLRVIVVRGITPSLLGIGMDGSPPDPGLESTMQILALALAAALLASAVVLRRRWLSGLVLFATGVGVAGVAIAIARLADLGPVVAGTEPRYLLPAVLFGALAVGALLSPQHVAEGAEPAAPRLRIGLPARWGAVATGVLALVLAGVYVGNLDHTRDSRRVSLDFSSGSKPISERLQRDVEAAVADGTADSIVDDKLPFPLFYQNDPRNRLTGYGSFFVAGGVDAPGIPRGGKLLHVAADGSLGAVVFQPAPGRPLDCGGATSCTLPVPAETDPVFVELVTDGGAARRVIALAVPPGATTATVRAPDGAALDSVTTGTLVPAPAS